MNECVDDVTEEISDIRSLISFVDKRLEQSADSNIRNQAIIFKTYIEQAKETLTRAIIRIDRLSHA